MNIGTIARQTIVANPTASNADLLAMTKAAAAAAGLENKTTVACIAWYKNDMKKNPKTVPQSQVQRTTDIVRSEIRAHEIEIESLKDELKQLEELETQKLLDEEQELIEKLAKIKALRGE